MNQELNFVIEDKSLEELIHDVRLYDGVRNMVYQKDANRETRQKKLEAIRIAELNSKIAILYQFFKQNQLHKQFQPEDNSDTADESFFVVTWGKVDDINWTCSKICRMLSDLSINRIASTQLLTNMYHELTEIIDGSRKKNKVFLRDEDFWTLYFKFYDMYHNGSDDDDDDDDEDDEYEDEDYEDEDEDTESDDD